MKTLIPDCFTTQTAICQDYPFGSGRCVRRVWFETATSGVAKGRMRMMAQTTTKGFNAQYNAKIAELGSREAALKWATEEFRVQLNRGYWNAPKASTYTGIMIPYLDDNQHVAYDGIHGVYDGPEKFEKLLMEWPNLPPILADKFNAMVAESREWNPRSWVAFGKELHA